MTSSPKPEGAQAVPGPVAASAAPGRAPAATGAAGGPDIAPGPGRPAPAVTPAPANTAPANAAPPVKVASVKSTPVKAAPSPDAGALGGAGPRLMLTGPAGAVPRPARMRPRHVLALVSFLLMVFLPLTGVVYYLWFVARDQYQSHAAFSVRTEKLGGGGGGILGALTSQFGTSGGAADGDVLFDYIRSQKMVETIDGKLGLERIYGQEGDPWFALRRDETIEGKLDYWHRMVDVSYDTSTNILTVAARAFSPDAAQAVVREILTESSNLVNALSDQAREDAIHNAAADLGEAEQNLRMQRQKMAEFRRENQMIDPQADIVGQAGVLNALQGQMAQAMVERDMLLSYADKNDQRVQQADRKIDAIRARINEERTNLGMNGGSDVTPSELLGRYEELKVDLEFANAAYTQALANVAVARAEARRQARYLVSHVEPTLAAESRFPERGLLTLLAAMTLLFAWGIGFVVYYNMRDLR